MPETREYPRKAVDPYLLWAIRTDYRGLRLQTDSQGQRLLTLVVLDTAPPKSKDAKRADSPFPLPNRQLAWSTGFRIAHRFAHDIVKYIEDNDAPFELSVPRQAQPIDDYKFMRLGGPDSGAPVLAVIDYGFAFAQETFRRWNPQTGAWSSRIAWLWDQSFEHHSPQDPQLPYGRLFSRKLIDEWLNRCASQGRVDEAELYRQAAYTQADRSLAHGTHVLALAAGRPTDIDCAARSDDLILVQLPRPTVLDTSGASMTAQVLLALDFIQSRIPRNAPLVVNLSYAAASGPHTGDTFLEQAMDQFIKFRQWQAHTAIVLPAGNGYLSDGHAQVRLTHRAPRAEIRWLVQADDPTDSFVEIWYDAVKAGKAGLLISLRAPDGTVLGPARPDHTVSDGTAAGIVHRGKSIFQPGLSVALVALAPTAHDAVPRAAAGIWVLTIEAAPADEALDLTVDAWVQRDDASLGEPFRTRQSRFVSNRSLADREVDTPSDPVHRAGTSNGFSHGQRTVVVGGCYSTGGLTRYTAAAPDTKLNRLSHAWPDVIAVAETSEALSGIPGAGTHGGARLRMNGTSVAAPQVARALLAQFERMPPPQNSSGGTAKPGQAAPVPAHDPLADITQPHVPPPEKPDDELRRGKGVLIPPC